MDNKRIKLGDFHFNELLNLPYLERMGHKVHSDENTGVELCLEENDLILEYSTERKTNKRANIFIESAGRLSIIYKNIVTDALTCIPISISQDEARIKEFAEKYRAYNESRKFFEETQVCKELASILSDAETTGIYVHPFPTTKHGNMYIRNEKLEIVEKVSIGNYMQDIIFLNTGYHFQRGQK